MSQAEVTAVYAGEEEQPTEKEAWAIDVSKDEYVPPEFEPEKSLVYYVPLRTEHDPKKEELLRLEALDIACRVLSGSKLPEHSQTWFGRGSIYADLHGWDKAISDYSKAIELDPNNAYIPYMRALAHLGMGDSEGYRKRCAQMLDHFGRTEEAGAAHWVAWTCVLASDAVDDFNRVIELAESAVEKGKTDQNLGTLGAVLYRAGRFDEAVQRLSGLAAEWEQGKELPTLSSPAYTWFFLAMAHHQLGNADQSQRYLELAVERAEQEKAGDVKWNRKLTLQLLRAEVESLLDLSGEISSNEKEVMAEQEK
jgi:tetratricopeptide (TPR) repeat protein